MNDKWAFARDLPKMEINVHALHANGSYNVEEWEQKMREEREAWVKRNPPSDPAPRGDTVFTRAGDSVNAFFKGLLAMIPGILILLWFCGLWHCSALLAILVILGVTNEDIDRALGLSPAKPKDKK